MHGLKRRMLMVFGLALAILGTFAAQPALAAEKEAVAYRLEKWKTIEFEDMKKAKTHYTTIKKLGCEVKQEDHNGHVDVSYRCPKWRELSLDSHTAAHKWEKWLKASGFETKHSH